ncbi:dna repair protein rad9 [Diplodia corticola]|uniref:DNA repair protein rad9 n=1 Tax=Diplodia corticola TaxID=236234 RepID=A0A1J9QKC5_9PEZI|nr:dna repair protein rad9 [Diplodia corticola]OJD28936.1 dna repair protein rad9 [Diplodia corticola]
MVVLNFTLRPEALAALHDALVCLAKFSDAVSLEARREKLSLTALNSSKSAYASFALDSSAFFSSYKFAPATANVDGRFTCRVYNKALLSVFKGRIIDPRGKDTTVDRCEVSLQDRPDQAECRLIIKMLSDQGVTKTYKLTYESVEVMHALFDKQSAQNRWSIHSSALREAIDYFGPKTEQLDIYAENGRVTYTSFTEKITNDKGKPTADFEHFAAAEQMHIVIRVKDFKAIVTHAHHLRASIQAYYSQPSRPLQFSYDMAGIGVLCEFTLMTIGDPQDQVNSSSTTPRVISTRSATTSGVHPTTARSTPSAADRQRTTAMPPPAAPVSRASNKQRRAPIGSATRPSQQKMHANEDEESLFVPYGDEDARWDPAGYGDDDEETLGWDASADPGAWNPTVRDSASTAAGAMARSDTGETEADGLAPTQRLSQIRGLW